MTVDCPSCTRDFDDQEAMRIHHARTHGESLVEPELSTCDHCGDEFEVSAGTEGKYCSRSCTGASRRNRETLTCEGCGEEFEVKPSDADGRRFCGNECRSEWMRELDDRDCEMCGQTFRPSRDSRRYCCRACRFEAETSKPRPDDPDMLVWLLYVYEGHNKTETYRRQRAVLGNEDRMYRSEVVERLEEMGVAGRYASDTVNAALAADASSPDETPGGDDTWRQYQEGSS
ncbi:hypothetical protein [Haloarcula sp. CBA1127]|uniref:hypothetical protein n=1 Tax=Haloarcula sp. CBA1127 TaxID=1765055 RepID=UPI00073E155D|nr:hypothetical protein [Haloarcula sp. CBA1127]